eukprot:COSAG06_NODE_32781_length_500_cov_1.209476_1_plen_58_part_00
MLILPRQAPDSDQKLNVEVSMRLVFSAFGAHGAGEARGSGEETEKRSLSLQCDSVVI